MLYSNSLLKTTMLAALLAAGISLTAQDQPAAPAANPPAKKPATSATKSGTAKTATGPSTAITTQKDKISYSIGADIGKRLRTDKLDVNPTVLARGLREAFAGAKLALTDQEMHAAIMQLQTDMRQKQMAEIQAISDKNKKEGDAFLAANKSKEGVVTLPSGLQYKILKAGDGPKPAATDLVVCNYRGTLINGKEFDSSYKRGEPATFQVTGVIKGWTEALQLMPVGSKWQLFIPPALAYGDRGQGPDITPGSTLVFEVELMSIQDKKAKDSAMDTNKSAAPDTSKPATSDTNKPDAPPDKQ